MQYYGQRPTLSCQKKKIGFILPWIETPTKSCVSESDFRKNYGAGQLIASKGISVWDFSQLNCPDSLFENQDHLNAIGGRKLNELLTQRLDSLRNLN